ncbi:antigen 5 like allergen Cul n 1-like isoform X2 [Wyeomyia smithii]|uniref:antigen 5 like allergen Cul n 1-like isoform X2 n=1 Tax=Wyeomyia smithii TaxID=174621 RepID=UPI002467BF5D|nr:antigen 5 like allergen Cul n 1-like isoform X2 [Wyeomyia smithii]
MNYLTAVVGFSRQDINYCSPQLCPNGITHVACNGSSLLASSCGAGSEEIIMDEAKIKLIVRLHNELRSKVATGKQIYAPGKTYPQASRMATLQWSPELATVAASNARRCVYGHDQCHNTEEFKYAGQNIAQLSFQGMTMSDSDLIDGFIYAWFSEYIHANPNIIARFPKHYSGPMIGHFTQMISDRATRIGCAVVSYNSGAWIRKYFVCNYSLANIIDQGVYEKGMACSRCRTGCNPKYPGLCNVHEPISSHP